ncbi:MAG: 8-oxo-dGTP diphosphatase [Clostridia bacterium]|nr:8-oxo-dGTP diphosphatase [Clostridia bacterium]
MINTTLCYIEKDGCYLMLHRVKKENDLNRDKWVGIGGKFEIGESPEECNARETLEETGLTLNSARYCGIVTFVSDKWGTEYMHLFHSDDFSGEIKECDEGDLEWIKKSDLYSLPLWAGDKIFLRLIDKEVPFFSLKLVYEGETLKIAVLDGKNLELGEYL